MSDNILVTPSNAPGALPVATRDLGGAQYQVMLLGLTSGSSAALLASGAAVRANSLPVALATDSAPMPDALGSDAVPLFLESWPQTLAYNANGTIASITAINGAASWRKTFSYTTGTLSGISTWVRQ